MPQIFISAAQFQNGLGITSYGSFPLCAQCDEDNNINILMPKPLNWDGDAMTLQVHGNASSEPNPGAVATVRSGLGDVNQTISYDNPDDVSISTDIQEGYMILGSAQVEPIGDGPLLRINIQYASETYGGSPLLISGVTLVYAAI